MPKHTHFSILGLSGRSLAAQNVIISICFFFMFMSLPSANALNNTQQQALEIIDFGYLGITLIVFSGCFFLFFVAGCIGCSRAGIYLNVSFYHAGDAVVENKGLQPTAIEAIPIFAYSYLKGQKLGKATLECAVCLTEFQDKDTIRLLPKCDHVFHRECIDGWLANHSTCPVCRANLVPASSEASAATGSDEPHEVVLAVAPEEISQTGNSMQNRPPSYPGRFPRSHSTGHSLVQPGGKVDRLILGLPHMVNMRQLSWSESMVALPLPTGLMSQRMGYRITGESGGRREKPTGAETGRLHDQTLPSSIVCTKAAESVLSLTPSPV